MAFKIIWSEQARDDLQSIVLFIAKDNPEAAASFGYLLMSKVDVLERFPSLAVWSRKKMMKAFEKSFSGLTELFTKFGRKRKSSPSHVFGMEREASRIFQKN
jgi:plasmid stabilization system protein ParE